MYLLGGKTSSAGLDDPQVDVSEASTEEMSEGNFSLNFSFHTFVNPIYPGLFEHISKPTGGTCALKYLGVG